MKRQSTHKKAILPFLETVNTFHSTLLLITGWLICYLCPTEEEILMSQPLTCHLQSIDGDPVTRMTKQSHLRALYPNAES